MQGPLGAAVGGGAGQAAGAVVGVAGSALSAGAVQLF